MRWPWSLPPRLLSGSVYQLGSDDMAFFDVHDRLFRVNISRGAHFGKNDFLDGFRGARLSDIELFTRPWGLEGALAILNISAGCCLGGPDRKHVGSPYQFLMSEKNWIPPRSGWRRPVEAKCARLSAHPSRHAFILLLIGH